ncbi:MAG: antibiotic biosynthesis monooxygenase [Chloroflexota bacterium]|nr:antibiotic biosynthesis monooxygenase [Chloroflexota bacterium]
MMTIITETTIESGQEPQWDEAFQERLADARQQPGWIALQLLIPLEAPNKRVVVGTWETRAAWEAWHNTETFQRTRQRMNELDQSDGQERWYEVVSTATRA